MMDVASLFVKIAIQYISDSSNKEKNMVEVQSQNRKGSRNMQEDGGWVLKKVVELSIIVPMQNATLNEEQQMQKLEKEVL